MSTNFYMSKDKHEVHLGKRSAGWAFLFRGNDTDKIHDLRSWYQRARRLEEKGYKLTNDNGSSEQTLKDLLITIKGLIGFKQQQTGYFDDKGNSFYDGEFS